MTILTITPFDEHKTTHKYQRASAYKTPVDLSNRLQAVITYIEGQVAQLRGFAGPRGLHFGEWSGKLNDKANLQNNQALVLDYRLEQFEAVQEQAERLGYARFWMTTENKARTTNTISLVIPFVEPVDAPTYERVASCIAKELDCYGLIDGALTATFITNIHATTLTGFERGPLLDAQAFKRMTAKMYQRQDAAKYYATARPALAAAQAHLDAPAFMAPEDMIAELFSF